MQRYIKMHTNHWLLLLLLTPLLTQATCPVVYEVNATNFTLPSPYEHVTIALNGHGSFKGDHTSYHNIHAAFYQSCAELPSPAFFLIPNESTYGLLNNGALTHTNYTLLDLDNDDVPNGIIELDLGPSNSDFPDIVDDRITRIVLNPSGGNIDLLQACKALEGTLLCLRPTLSENTLTFHFTTEMGTQYQPQFTTALDGVWQDEGASITGDGSEKSFSRTLSQPHGFYRLETN